MRDSSLKDNRHIPFPILLSKKKDSMKNEIKIFLLYKLEHYCCTYFDEKKGETGKGAKKGPLFYSMTPLKTRL